MRDFAPALRGWQDEVTAALESFEPARRFREDRWERPGGGGGLSRVLEGGEVFERAGVNFSQVFGELPDSLARTLPGAGAAFSAVGVSIVVHPRSPMVPTTHANYRFFQRGETCWFGGGADLTPYYLFDEDARHFHRTLREACDACGPDFHARFKRACDQYFFLKHRGEARGVGGVFFDHLPAEKPAHEALWTRLRAAFLPAYLPIVERRRAEPWGEPERAFQLMRRGRYVEFNLVHDKGTLFGLATQGRTESILMSLPPLVAWTYTYEPSPGSREASLIEVLRQPRDWA